MKFEKYFYYLLVLLHLLPVLVLPYFVTHDGPTHVYNANLIHQLLFDTDSTAALFFEFNPQVLPNWISHILLELFMYFVDGAVAERIVIAIYIVAFPLSFRFLVLAINPKAIAATYLIFPYVQAFSILTGLYSFCLGLCILFYLLYKWKSTDLPGRKKKFYWLSMWMILLYFSHLFVFILAMLSIGSFISWRHLTEYGSSLKNLFNKISLWWQELKFLILVSIIPLVLTTVFAFHQASKTDTEIPEFDTMLELFMDVRPIIALNYDMEKTYSEPLFYVYCILFLAAIFMRLRSGKKDDKSLFIVSDVWLILSGLMTLFYFVLPDDIFSGGIVAIRFCLMSYLFFILWLAASCPPKLVVAASVLSVLSSILLLNQRFPSLRSLSDDAKDFATCAEHIEEGSILLTLNYSENWMMDNIASYISSDKNIVLLDNYEANQVHFPLIWKEDRDPNEIVGNSGKSNRPCIDLNKFTAITGRYIDYILVMKRPSELNDSCTISADAQIRESYKEVFVTPFQHGVLYKRMNLLQN
jgi:hypothetical protein